MGLVAAAVVASLVDREAGYSFLPCLSHLQKLIITFSPQQETHTPQSPMAQQCHVQARYDPGHWFHTEQGWGQGLCGWGRMLCFCIMHKTR
jgi:hypothetical protein